MKTMNTIITILFLFFCIKTYSQTQSDRKNEEISKVYTSREAKKKFVWGGKVGLTRSNVYDAQGMNFLASSKTGIAGGLFAAIPLGALLGIQPEVLISQKGFTGSGTINNDSYTLTRTTTHLDIPLQLQLKPVRFFSIVGGIQYSYLLSQNDELSSGTNSLQQDQEFKNDNIQKNILGAVTGFDINVRHIILSGRAGCDMQTNRSDGSSYTPGYKNVWLQGTIGYRFY